MLIQFLQIKMYKSFQSSSCCRVTIQWTSFQLYSLPPQFCAFVQFQTSFKDFQHVVFAFLRRRQFGFSHENVAEGEATDSQSVSPSSGLLRLLCSPSPVARIQISKADLGARTEK